MKSNITTFFSQKEQRDFFAYITNTFGFTRREVDSSKLKLEFLKENHEYQQKFEELRDYPFSKKIPIFFDFIVNKFGLNKKFLQKAQSFKFSFTEIDALLEPIKEPNKAFSRKLINMLPILFTQDGIEELFKIRKLARWEEYKNRDWNYLNPSERILKIDLRKRKSELIKELRNYIERELSLQKAAKQVWEIDQPLSYLLWEPENERQRKEAWSQLKVWKLRKQYINFNQIAIKLKIKKDTAKKRFYKAYERIYRKPFDKSKFKDVVLQNLEQHIKTGSDSVEKQKSTIYTLLELEETGQKEKLLHDERDLSTDETSGALFEEDRGVKQLVRDIRRGYCNVCPDTECKNKFNDACKGGPFEEWDPCPEVIKFLEE